MLTDSFGRTVSDLRISVTDRCNFRCTYCMPEEGIKWLPRDEILTFEEIARIARIAVERYSVESIRITGGEPTVRADIVELISMISPLVVPATGKPVDLAMTTNGARLKKLATPLRAAGLDRLNISIDSLKRERFLEMTRRDELHTVLAGIDAAIDAGFTPIKLNAVVVRGFNDDEVVDMVAFARERNVTIRFIEFMPLDADELWSSDKVVSSDEIVAAVTAHFPAEREHHDRDPALRYRFVDGHGEFGVISSVSEPFCESCDRIRLTAEGKIRNCLFALDEFDLRTSMRDGADDDTLATLLEESVWGKWAGHSIGNVNFIRPGKSMSQIGG